MLVRVEIVQVGKEEEVEVRVEIVKETIEEAVGKAAEELSDFFVNK